MAQGADLGLKLAGYHALNSLRLEKGYRHWGHDITDEDTPLQAGLGFAVGWNKADFLGKAALLKEKESGSRRRLLLFALSDPTRMLYHNEPVWRDGELIGRITSGMFGHTIGKPLGLGYVENAAGLSDADLLAGRFEIEVAGDRIPAEASLQPLYDPKNARVRDIAPPSTLGGPAAVT